MAASSVWLPRPWSGWTIGAQIAFYAVAAADVAIPERFPAKRITSLVRAFVVLIAAALCATSIFFRPSNSFWQPVR